jgi:outer membrane murein-binding lipoprotein Lpp
MKRLVVPAIVLLGTLALAGCGAREELKPRATASLPVAPAGARTTPSSTDLLQPPVQTRPARSDDLIESTNQRRSDKFDLPPR